PDDRQHEADAPEPLRGADLALLGPEDRGCVHGADRIRPPPRARETDDTCHLRWRALSAPSVTAATTRRRGSAAIVDPVMQTTSRTRATGPAVARSEAAVVVRDLHVHFGDFAAVRGIDLDVRRGEVFALLGTNGAGKTTTLEVLEGFRPRSRGTVSVLGLDPAVDRAALQRRIGVQLQDGGFVDELTVQETLALWQQLVERPDRPERLLARFELCGRRDVPVGKLSGGEERRLDLALAVWGSPELVVLEEPTTGLAPESRRRAGDASRGPREAGRTVVLTTHYLEEAEALADRVAIMPAGRVAVAGTLGEIVSARPAG